MNCKIEMPNGLKMECNEGVEKLFNLLKNMNDFGLLPKDEKKEPTVSVKVDVENIEKVKSELERIKSEHEKLIQENNMLKTENEDLKTQILGIQQDTSDIDYLQGEIERLEKENNKLVNENVELNNKIKELENKLSEQPKIYVESRYVPDQHIHEVKEEKINPLNVAKNIIPDNYNSPSGNLLKNISKSINNDKVIEQPSDNKVDFNPNNAKDLAWLQNQLGASVQNNKSEETPIQPIDNREMIDGYYIERNSNGQIVKINNIDLTTSEIMGLQYKITTVPKIMENKKLIEENDKANASMASGWGEQYGD